MPVHVETGATDLNKAMAVWQAVTPTVTASTSEADYPVANILDPATWSSWQPSATGASYVTFDFGSAVAVDSVGIAAHNAATSAATITVSSSADNISYTTRATYAPLTDDDAIMLFPSQTARYWRIGISQKCNIGVGVVGARLLFPHTPIDSYTPINHARQYEKVFTDSIRGQFLGNRVMSAGAETTVDLGFVQRTFVDGPMRSFESHYNQGGTFFYAGWPGGQVLDMGYCRSQSVSDIVEVEYIQGEKLANLSFTVRAYVGT